MFYFLKPILRLLFPKGKPGGQLLSVGFILIIVVGLYFLFFKKDKTFRDIQPTSLLKKIEYIEQLKLVTYYYEEIIVLGTKNRVEKIVERQGEKVQKAETELFAREFELMRIEGQLDIINQELFEKVNADSLQALIEAEQKLEKARILFHGMDRTFSEFSKIRKDLEKNENAYGQDVSTEFAKYKATEVALNVQKKLKRKKRDPKEIDRLSRSLELLEVDLRSAISKEKSKRRGILAKYLDEVKMRKFRLDRLQSSLKKDKKDTEKALEKAQKAYDKARNDLTEKKLKLAQAEGELAAAKDKEENMDPRLLIVVPAKVSAYIDMRDLQFNANLFSGNTLQLKIPMPKLDSVLISLDSTDHYELSNKLDLDISQQGVYYDIYQQLKDAILEKEQLVKEKALNAGILEETHQMAEEYIEDFAKTLGYEVTFYDELRAVSDSIRQSDSLNTTEYFMKDSTQQLIREGRDSIKDGMLDSIDHQEEISDTTSN